MLTKLGRGALRAGAVMALLLSAASAALPEKASARAEMHQEGILLRVTNRGWSDVIVYLQEGGVPRRLGKVPSQGRALLGIPAVFMTGMPLRLLLRAEGRTGTHAAEGVSARPGQIIELYVPPILGMSSVVVR